MAQTTDPREAGAQPPFPKQEQSEPGLEQKMDPRPDYGEESYRGSDRLTGRVALVTGGDSGIGRAVALAFAREGADVAISYLEEQPDAQETTKAVEDSGRKALAIPGDISSVDHCHALVEQTVAELGRIDILVNNAAWQSTGESFLDIKPEDVEKAFRTNLFPLFHLCQAAIPHMEPGAAIVNTASIQAYDPSPALLHYSTTKGAIVTFTKGLAQELVEKGIRVNAVAPGPVWTPLIVMSFDPQKSAEFGKDNPMGRPAQPAELAPAYVFLASDESRFITGEVLAVTGGLRAGA
jgi:NAD(P)-dependent dehydrogenase (short-subunit alcohol dehydrogenase family)